MTSMIHYLGKKMESVERLQDAIVIDVYGPEIRGQVSPEDFTKLPPSLPGGVIVTDLESVGYKPKLKKTHKDS